jgi:2-dehydro-3-deoxy-D-arabinonate dehydratase
LYIPKDPLSSETKISIEILRSDDVFFTGETSLSQMKRSPEELTGFLFRETSFDKGVFLMTGTGIIPDNNFSLEPGDTVSISIDLVGNLVNSVE